MSKQIFGHETSTLYVNQSNQNWSVDIGGSIEVANGHGMVNYAPYYHSVMTTSGAIIADGLYKDGMYSEGNFATLQVDTMGSIHAYNGIAFYGAGTYAENLGKITVANIGIYGHADSIKIANWGAIKAKTGIYIEDGPDASPYSTVTNYGTITADYGIVALSGDANVTNYAKSVIDAKITAIMLGGKTTDANHIINSGLISSADTAILGSAGRDMINNYGTIKGKIFLGAGNDVFDGRDGTVDHAVDGGLGDDSYIFGTQDFAIVDAGGSDTISSSTSRSLAFYVGIENLSLLGNLNINGTGNAASNFIAGNDGNNVLDGGIDNVVDTLQGGMGNDTYVLGAGSDQVIDQKSGDDTSSLDGGIDTITSTISRYLADYSSIENLKLLGSANIDGAGNKSANVITGNAGDNILDGGVESSDVIDTLNGGKGNDTYMLGAGHDKVVDSAGIDTITSTITRSLASYPTIENLTLLGNGNINGTGNALANVIAGNDADNILDGGVDTVIDTLKGGSGNDTYVLGNGADKIIETAGIDMITSTITRSLADYTNIEISR